jgi:hypothetical protein
LEAEPQSAVSRKPVGFPKFQELTGIHCHQGFEEPSLMIHRL